MPQLFINGRQVKIKLTNVFRHESHGLKFDDNITAQFQVVEKEIRIEVFSPDLKMDLTANIGKTSAKLQ